MKAQKLILPLLLFIVFNMIAIFLTGIVLYMCGEFFFFFYKGIEMSFSSTVILLISKISIYIGCFSGLMLWIANSLKK